MPYCPLNIQRHTRPGGGKGNDEGEKIGDAREGADARPVLHEHGEEEREDEYHGNDDGEDECRVSQRLPEDRVRDDQVDVVAEADPLHLVHEVEVREGIHERLADRVDKEHRESDEPERKEREYRQPLADPSLARGHDEAVSHGHLPIFIIMRPAGCLHLRRPRYSPPRRSPFSGPRTLFLHPVQDRLGAADGGVDRGLGVHLQGEDRVEYGAELLVVRLLRRGEEGDRLQHGARQRIDPGAQLGVDGAAALKKSAPPKSRVVGTRPVPLGPAS